MERLKGKTAIITGGAGGIGLAAVRFFRASGAEVIIADIDESAGAEAAAAPLRHAG
ncbi:MAG: SDR family NAD(P)-dependent oxidoreductase [Lentisphaeria bacterium]|nr:SDR family NAD(P)-dependent oxidoreductase [Lentisphaeria bacterium]